MAIKAKILIAVILVSLFVHDSAFAGFSLRKSSNKVAPETIGSSRVDDVEREIMEAIISKKPNNVIKKNERLYIKTNKAKAKEKQEPQLVTGFGQDLPLVISLQQILPSEYQFTLSNGIDPNILTSWEGGKEWKTVLTSMLKKNGMSYIVTDGVVIIKSGVKVKSKSKAVREQKQARKIVKPKTKVISKKRKPKIKSEKVLKPTPRYQAKSHKGENKSNNNMTPLNIISSENTPIKIDEDLRPFFDENMRVAENDPLAMARWVGNQHQTLKEVLTEWCEKEDVELYWTIDYDYKLNKDIAFMDEFEVSVAKLIDMFRNVRPQPYGQLHQGDRGPLVLVVNSYDLSH